MASIHIHSLYKHFQRFLIRPIICLLIVPIYLAIILFVQQISELRKPLDFYRVCLADKNYWHKCFEKIPYSYFKDFKMHACEDVIFLKTR